MEQINYTTVGPGITQQQALPGDPSGNSAGMGFNPSGLYSGINGGLDALFTNLPGIISASNGSPNGTVYIPNQTTPGTPNPAGTMQPGNNYTPWLIGGMAVLFLLVLIILVFKK